MKPILVGAVAVSIAVVPTLGTAGPAPTALLGKSVIATWGEERI